ncbi:MAG TPA: long-chain fatty acid--CoA ligase [Candidatus Saccharimonadales bacterium]|nr:long-chain fatty acid--CoA ligase [Candidatus Saccharimonadales bacterium]
MSFSVDGLRTAPATPEHGAWSWLAARAALTPDREALVDGTLRTTYRGLATRSLGAARLLWELGVRPGDRVATLTANRGEFVELLYAVARVGAILCPLNWRLAHPELEYQLADAGARVLFTEPAQAEAAGRLDVVERVMFGRDYADRRDAARAEPPAEAEAGFSDPYLILYTAGTTGRAKGAVLTHANVFWNVVNMTVATGLSEADTTVTILPMFHSGGIGLFTVPSLTVGGRVIIQRSFDAAGLRELIVSEGAAVVLGVPATWLAMAELPEFSAQACPSLRYLCSGGAPLPTPLIDRLADRGFVVLQGYGLTETAPGGTLLPPPDWRRKAGTVGKPMLFVQLRAVADDGTPVPAGTVGEVQFRGPNVFAGYWRRPEATAEVFTADGWFRTGDLGVFDDEGFLTLVDRKKDMVITGGENVYSAEVEDVLFAHPAIAEAAIVGMPDERWGERVVAVVVARPGSAVTAEELIAFCHERLAKYKSPREVVFIDVLPRNAAGKVLKRQLREQVRPPPVEQRAVAAS